MGCRVTKVRSKSEVRKKISHLSPDELQELQRIFQKIDKDSNGKLNHYELKFLLKSLRQFVMEREMMDIMKEADVNHDGKIDLSDFIDISCTADEDGEYDVRAAFKIFDREGKGYIVASDVREILKNLGQDPLNDQEIEDIIDEADLDKNGRINIDEFIEVVKEP